VSIVDQNVTALERAFQLAKSGNIATLDALKHQLKTEGYSVATVTGKALTMQLRAIIHASQRAEKPC
jgi:transketolase N-terminal domain/subunit